MSILAFHNLDFEKLGVEFKKKIELINLFLVKLWQIKNSLYIQFKTEWVEVEDIDAEIPHSQPLDLSPLVFSGHKKSLYLSGGPKDGSAPLPQ